MAHRPTRLVGELAQKVADLIYRLDTASARQFLSPYLTLP